MFGNQTRVNQFSTVTLQLLIILNQQIKKYNKHQNENELVKFKCLWLHSLQSDRNRPESNKCWLLRGGAYIGDVCLGDGRPTCGVEPLPDAAHHGAENPQQGSQLGQGDGRRGNVLVHCLSRNHVTQVLRGRKGVIIALWISCKLFCPLNSQGWQSKRAKKMETIHIAIKTWKRYSSYDHQNFCFWKNGRIK